MIPGAVSYSLAQVAARLAISPAGQALCTGWVDAMPVPWEQSVAFLRPGYITEAGKVVALADEMIQDLIQFAQRICNDEYVVTFFWYCRHRILNDPSLVQSWEEQWPPLDGYLGQEAGLLNVLVMLSTVPEMHEVYRKLGIPDDLMKNTVADLRLWMETDLYYQCYQRWGITPWIARWLCHHWQGRILRLGRLQFSLGSFGGRLRAYRHKKSGELLALSEASVRYSVNGDAWCALCGNEAGAWTSTLEIDDSMVTGNPITPDGRAHRQTQRLDLDQWELVLSSGNPMLTIHIPAGESLSFETCGDSFQNALEVFPRYFPDFHFRGFSTGTWLLDARLQALLPAESNIVRLQREVYLYPGLQGDNHQIYERIFGWGTTDINAVPWKTSLQRTIGNYLNAGGHFHGGYCFLLREDLSWGDQVYLSS